MAQADYPSQTPAMLERGLRVFQGAMLATDEAEHCRLLYDYFAMPQAGVVVDMGCGIGEVSRQFSLLEPSLKCIGVTNEPCQMPFLADLEHSVLADFEATGLHDAVADVVMFNESFGYGEVRALLHESHRLLKPGGRLCIKDYSFAAYRPVDTLRQRAWGYTVHDPDALVAYADKMGFDAMRVMPQIQADFTRWIQAIQSEPAFAQHALPSDDGEVFAAIYVFTKRQALPDTHEGALHHALRGHADAIQLVHDWHAALHLWDDLIDADVAVPSAAIHRSFQALLVGIPANPFFQTHRQHLLPILASGITAWHAANVMESKGQRNLLNQAHMLRVQVGAAFVACAELIGGPAWAQQVAPMMWQEVQGDRLSDYTREIDLSNQQRIIKAAHVDSHQI